MKIVYQYLTKAETGKDKIKTNTVTMKNVSHKKKWNVGLVQVHMEPPPIPLIKINHYDK